MPDSMEALPGVNASGLPWGSGDHALIALISVHWSKPVDDNLHGHEVVAHVAVRGGSVVLAFGEDARRDRARVH